MSSKAQPHTTPGSGRRIFWRSLEHKAAPDAAADQAAGSDVVKQTIDAGDLLKVNRRNFVTLSGAIGALAGLEGCIRRPEEKILPYVAQPEYVNPGIAMHYASVLERQGEALGVLVTSNEGTPTKIEGNPDHPASQGGADMYAQAEILELYDSDRAQAPSKGGAKKTWAEVDSLIRDLRASRGAGVRVLAQPSVSPTYLQLRDAVRRDLPAVRFHTYSSVNQSNQRDGGKLAFGRPVNVLPDYSKAKVVLALDCDFMLTEQGAVRASRQFAQARNMDDAHDETNRLYAVEPTMSVTGSNADHRLRLAAQDVAGYAQALAGALSALQVPLSGVAAGAKAPAGVPKPWLDAVAKELVTNRGKCLVVAGSRQPAAVHALVFAINRALGNVGQTVSYRPVIDAVEASQFDNLKALTDDMMAGKVKALLILGGNPVYEAPGDVPFATALAKVATSICVSSHMDETARLCTWQVPRAHALESWGDQQALSGEYSVQQPLLGAIWRGRSDIEVMAALAGEPAKTGYDLVRQTTLQKGHIGEEAWRKLLHTGVAPDARGMLGAMPVREAQVVTALAAAKGGALGPKNMEAVFLADNKMLGGRYSNNTWMLELPDPITNITWDNAALLAPSTADSLGIENGDMIRVSKGDASVEIVAWKQPGMAAHSVGLPLGWGRTAAGKGGYGYAAASNDEERSGFDVAPLRTADAPGFTSGIEITKLGGTYKLSQTQEHDAMEDRPLAIDATVAEYREKPDFTQWAAPDPSVPPLWETVDYTKGVQWGMVVDLNLCNGCNACVVACQAENNIPTVGKEQIARGREMAWFRIDRYYVGEDADEPEVAYQPIGCQHCEEAPCENVCPVAATSHSDEGLNDIAYNRCIGTRYCMNNCPYKVRRFNFLNFNTDVPETLAMQRNPNVSNRFRGVVEKCSYCVQRVQASKIKARREERDLVDGEAVSACMQTCPTEAITFGDINDPKSKVSKRRAVDRNYGLLAEVGTRPRTRFLGKVRNPNPEMQA